MVSIEFSGCLVPNLPFFLSHSSLHESHMDTLRKGKRDLAFPGSTPECWTPEQYTRDLAVAEKRRIHPNPEESRQFIIAFWDEEKIFWSSFFLFLTYHHPPTVPNDSFGRATLVSSLFGPTSHQPPATPFSCSTVHIGPARNLSNASQGCAGKDRFLEASELEGSGASLVTSLGRQQPKAPGAPLPLSVFLCHFLKIGMSDRLHDLSIADSTRPFQFCHVYPCVLIDCRMWPPETM